MVEIPKAMRENLTDEQVMDKLKSQPGFTPPDLDFPKKLDDKGMMNLINVEAEEDYFERKLREVKFETTLTAEKNKNKHLQFIADRFGIEPAIAVGVGQKAFGDTVRAVGLADTQDQKEAKAIRDMVRVELRDKRIEAKVRDNIENKIQATNLVEDIFPLTAPLMPFDEVRAINRLSDEEIATIAQDVNEGLRRAFLRDPTYVEIISPFFLPFIAEAFLAAPAVTALTLGTFVAMDEIESATVALVKKREDIFFQGLGVQDLLPDQSSDAARDIVETLAFAGKIYGVHGLSKTKIGQLAKQKAGALDAKIERFQERIAKDIIEQYNLPKTLFIEGDKVVRIFHPGKGTEITLAELDLVKQLGLDGKGYKQAFKQGVTIEIPAEKIVTIQDRPWFAQLKGFFKLKPSPRTTTIIQAGKAEPKITGLLEEKLDTADIVGRTRFTEREFKRLRDFKAEALPLDVQEFVLEKIEVIDQKTAEIEANPQFTSEQIAERKALVDLKTAEVKQIVQTGKVEGFEPIPEPKKAVPAPAVAVEPDVVQPDFVPPAIEGEFPEVRPLTVEARQLLDLAQTNLPATEFDLNKVLQTAEKIADLANQSLIDNVAIAEAIQFGGDAEQFVAKAIRNLVDDKGTPVDFTTEQQQRAKEVFGKGASERVIQAEKELRDFIADTKGLTPAKVLAKVERLVNKFVKKPKAPEKPQVIVTEKEAGEKKPTVKPIKNSDKFEKTPAGDTILFEAVIAGKKFPILSSSKVFNNLKPVEFPEIVRIAKELMGTPKVQQRFRGGGTRGQFSFKVSPPGQPGTEVRIDLQPELFEEGNEFRLALVLAHEVGHLIDYLPELEPFRSNLLGRLLKLRQFLREHFGEFQITNSKVREELMALSELVRPLTPDKRVSWQELKKLSPDHFDYRVGSNELYADFVSVLFNSPGLAEQIAPNTMELFFNSLDKNIQVKNVFVNLQKALTGTPENLLEQRQGIMREAFIKGDEIRKKLNDLAKLKQVNFWESIHDLVFEANGPLLRKVRNKEAKGAVIPRGDDPIYELQEDSMIDSENMLLIADMDLKVFHPLTEAGIDKMELDFYMFLKRVVGRPDLKVDDFKGLFEELDGTEKKMVVDLITNLVERGFVDRKNLANPFGFAPKTAQRQIDFIKRNLGDEKFKILEKAAKNYHDIVFQVVEQAVIDGTYSPTIFNKVIKENKDFYVTFGVLNYIQQFVPPGVKMQVGTLADIERPSVTTTLKMIALARFNSKNRAISSAISSLQKVSPDEAVRLGRLRFERGVPMFPKPARGKGILTLWEEGVPVMYLVDKSIAEMFEHDKIGNLQLISVLDKWLQNDIWKNIFISWNIGFAVISNPQRDIRQTLKTLQAIGAQFDLKVPIWKLMKEWFKALPSGAKIAKGEIDATVREMMSIKALNKPLVDFAFHPEVDPLTRLLEELEILKTGRKTKNLQGAKQIVADKFISLLEGIRYMGSTIEQTTKIAGYNILKEVKLSDKERAYLTRNFVSTPNFNEKGKFSPITNRLFMFSNIMIRDYSRNIQLASNPKTRGAFWWATLRWSLLPTFLSFLAIKGRFGDDVENAYRDISEYDRTNYHNIPLGRTDDGRVIYLRLFQDDFGRLVSGIMWKMMMATEKEKPKKFTQVFDFMGGQLPNYSPTLKILGMYGALLSGNNPFDSFRQRYAVNEREWRAGGLTRIWGAVRWQVDQTGLGQYITAFTRADKRDNWMEATVRHNFATNRLLKISDSGLNQLFTEFNEIEQKENDVLFFKRQAAYKRHFKEFQEGRDIDEIFGEIEDEVFLGEKITRQQRRTMQNGFMSFVIREEHDVFINGLRRARSNDVKFRILEVWSERRPPEEFEEIIPRLREFNLIGDVVERQFRALLEEIKENAK